MMEVIIAILLIGYSLTMALNIITTANRTEIRLRARSEAWQVMNEYAAPSQLFNCVAVDSSTQTPLCEWHSTTDTDTTHTNPPPPLVAASDEIYTRTGWAAIYTITVKDCYRRFDLGPPGKLLDCATTITEMQTTRPLMCADTIRASRTITIEWQPDGSPIERIERDVFGPALALSDWNTELQREPWMWDPPCV